MCTVHLVKQDTVYCAQFRTQHTVYSSLCEAGYSILCTVHSVKQDTVYCAQFSTVYSTLHCVQFTL